MTAPEPIFMTAKEAAERLGAGMTEKRLRALATAGEIAHRRSRRFLQFTQADLDEYAASIAVPRRTGRTRSR